MLHVDTWHNSCSNAKYEAPHCRSWIEKKVTFGIYVWSRGFRDLNPARKVGFIYFFSLCNEWYIEFQVAQIRPLHSRLPIGINSPFTFPRAYFPPLWPPMAARSNYWNLNPLHQNAITSVYWYSSLHTFCSNLLGQTFCYFSYHLITLYENYYQGDYGDDCNDPRLVIWVFMALGVFPKYGYIEA